MKRNTPLFCLFVLFPVLAAFAQVSADPLDFFYTDLSVWETSGIVGHLPPARPYPLPVVKNILQQVMDRGDREQRYIARSHYRRLFGKAILPGTQAELATDMPGGRRQMAGSLSLDANLFFSDLVTGGASIDAWMINKLPMEEILPASTASTRDIVPDNAKLGPFYMLPSFNSSLSVGTDRNWFTMGLMRGSYGPFADNGIIVGSQALHSGQFNYTVYRENWSYTSALYSITANDGFGVEYRSGGIPKFPEKYLSVHSFEYAPFDWLSVSLLEAVMWGDRFEPLYMLPSTPYMISQSVSGLNDNSFLGGMFTVKPLRSLKVDGVLYADDLSFNDMIRFNFDTKWRLAGQLGASYAPRKTGIFARAGLDYTMVTPFMYSHKNGDEISLDAPNYQNYMHFGQNFGAALEPNSDRVNLSVKLRPLEGVDVDIVGTLIRHGNIYEDIPEKWIREYITAGEDLYITDGGILSSSGTKSAGHLYNYTTPFLAQDTLQYIWQTGFTITCRLPVLKTGGHMVFRLGYRFELNINEGIRSQVYRYDSAAAAALDSDPTNEDWKAVAENQRAEWLDNATGRVFNNYISAGFEYWF